MLYPVSIHCAASCEARCAARCCQASRWCGKVCLCTTQVLRSCLISWLHSWLDLNGTNGFALLICTTIRQPNRPVRRTPVGQRAAQERTVDRHLLNRVRRISKDLRQLVSRSSTFFRVENEQARDSRVQRGRTEAGRASTGTDEADRASTELKYRFSQGMSLWWDCLVRHGVPELAVHLFSQVTGEFCAPAAEESGFEKRRRRFGREVLRPLLRWRARS